MVFQLYVSRTSGNFLMKIQQDYIKRIFESKNIPFEEIDVADPHRQQQKLFMQTTLQLDDSDLVTLPPQVFKEKNHRGDYASFLTAVECERLYEYLDMAAPPHEVEYQRKIEQSQ